MLPQRLKSWCPIVLHVVKQSADSAVKRCKKLGRPDAKCAAALKHLFPATSPCMVSKKRIFDPEGNCVVVGAQKKKATNVRIKPKCESVVMLHSMPQHVPKGYARSGCAEVDKFDSCCFAGI